MTNIDDLFKEAHREGDLSLTSLQALTLHHDLGAQIQAGLGIQVDDVAATEVVLVTMMPDDSGSIRFAGNSDRVMDGHNMVLEALENSRQGDGVLAHTRYLNGHVLYPYLPLNDAIPMNSMNYNPNLGTPLYDQMVVLLGTVLAKSREFEDAGVPVRTVTLIITDGADAHSREQSPDAVRALVEDLLRSENHTIAAMGIDDGDTDFHAVFRSLGVPEAWILTPGNSASEIRQAFQLFSQSAVQLSQGQAGLAGFGS